jgi:hypothetical protein
LTIDETPIHEKVQNLHIVHWTITKEEQLTKMNLCTKENLQQMKINIDLEPIISVQLVELLKELKDIFAWTYKNLKGIPLEIAQH